MAEPSHLERGRHRADELYEVAREDVSQSLHVGRVALGGAVEKVALDVGAVEEPFGGRVDHLGGECGDAGVKEESDPVVRLRPGV